MARRRAVASGPRDTGGNTGNTGNTNPNPQPTRRTKREMKEIETNESAAGLSRDVLFGRTVQGLKLLYANSFNNGTLLYLVAAVGEGPLRSIVPRADDQLLTYVSGAASSTTGARYSGPSSYLTAWVYDGGVTPDVSVTGLTSFHSAWNANAASYANLAIAVLRLQFNEQHMASVPKFTFDVEGYRDIYDPRNGTRGYTENAALVIREVMTNTRWGMKIPAANIDDATFSEAANDCAVAIFPAAPATAVSASASGAAGTGSLNGFYWWRVTFVSASGVETPPSPPPASYLYVQLQNASVTLPLGDSLTASRKLYRSLATNPTAYRLVATIANNTATSYVDAMTDAAWWGQPPMNGAGPLSTLRYPIGINVSRQSTAADWLETLRAHCLGVFSMENAKYQLRIDKPLPGGYVKQKYSEHHNWGGNKEKPNVVPESIRWGRRKRSELFNEVEIRFTDLQNNWAQGTVVKSRQSVVSGAEVARRATYELPGLFDSSIAARVATQMLNLAWDDAWFEWEADRSALETMPWDVVQITGGGLVNQDVRVRSVSASANGFVISGTEYNPASYSDSIVQADAPLTGGTVGVIAPADLNPPLSLTLSEEVDEPQPGVFFPKLVVNFEPNMSPKYGGTVLKVQIGTGPEKTHGTYYYGPVRIPIPEPGKTVTVRAYTAHKSGAEGTTPATAAYTMYDPSNPVPIGPIMTVSGEAYWDRPPIRSVTAYGASAWTASGTSIFVNSAMNNGDLVTAALQFNTAANGLVRLDSGSAQAMREIEVYWLDTDNRPFLTFEWSDDGTNFTQISTGWATELTGKTVYPIPSAVGAHRYWRVAKYSTTPYVGRISEIRFLTFTGATYPYVKGYRLTGFNTTGAKYSKDITFQPTATNNRVLLSEFQYSYSTWDSVNNTGSGGSTTELTVQTLSPTNAVSEGRFYRAMSAWSTTGQPGEQNWLPLGQTSFTPAVGVNPNVDVFAEQLNNVVRLSGTNTNWSLGGFTNGYAGRMITVINATTSEGSLVHEDATSTAANRLALPDNVAAALPVGTAITLVYDDVSLRWRRLDRHSAALDKVRVLSGSGYGSINVQGSANGYAGIHFTDAARVLMISSQYQGVHTTAGAWQWYWNNGTLEAGSVPWARVTAKPNVQPNDGTYGSIKATGAANSWPGIWFSDAGTAGYLLWSATQQGSYDTAVGWKWRFNNGTLDIGTVPGSAVSAPRAAWQSNSPVTAQELGWRNYGNGHTVVENSGQNYRPNNANPDIEWSATYPTLMGFNGSNTYGVRVDRARYAEHLKAGASVASSPANGDNSTAVATTAWVLANGGSSMERVSALNPSGNVAYGNQENYSGSKPRGFVTNRGTSQSVSNITIVSVTGKGALRFLSGGMNSNIGWLTLVIDGTNVITDAVLNSSNSSMEPGLHTAYVGAIVSSWDATNSTHHISAIPSDYGITFKTSLTIYMRTNSTSITAYCNYAYALY